MEYTEPAAYTYRGGAGAIRALDGGDWRMWERAPARPLTSGLVGMYEGYWERRAVPLRRSELPYGGVTLILTFGDVLAITPHSGAPEPEPYGSFVAGLFDEPVVTEHSGTQHGMEIRLTPAGAHAAFGAPPGAYANQVVRWDDLAPRPLAGLAGRMAEEPTWEARFALADRVLCGLVAEGPERAPEVSRAVELLTRTEGRVRVAELARVTGWSRRRLTGRFREQVGMTPKVYARVLRFQHALRLLERPGGAGGLAAVAAACGYYDQAHLNRDFRAMAGCSPTAHLADRCPPGAFPFVQDAAGAGA